jgi:tetratricopeptide (TPR) repeat protein
MSELHELPERLRARLLAAAIDDEAEALPLAAGAEQRITAALVAEAQRATARARSRHMRFAGLLAAAASLAIALWPAGDAQRAVSPAACALPAGLALAERGGAGRIDLGVLGDILASEGTRLSVKTSTACTLEVAVSGGSVLVDVHKLAPARLVLTTPHGDVLVRGTQFALDVADDALDVHLVSGRVEVTDAAQTFVLEAGHSLSHRRAGAARTRALADSDRNELRRLMALRRTFLDADPAPAVKPAAVPEPAPSAGDPVVIRGNAAADFLARAEAARQSGAVELARRNYEKATHAAPADAEVALLRWARFELEVGRRGQARALLVRHRRAHPRGALAAEAAWLSVEVAERSGDTVGARREAAALVRAHPGTPQAEAAARLLGGP